uniref:RING-type domain-containing protein n=1 Tax=Chromera velia CCMP2878 TaxID=1169474 RepID=A0A0G4HXH5_9ALVE|eukprot:Cvel_9268.t1-p1 / transcript=Cvel_9268.t1 / gene=Cvel_9268 / organism=Chromera_velia_CCMP2878 / gene_product=TNF receptor-associated factor family protein, putative / transcript_product=TNF receptor-associated factor family protein, putative / location=Cvel_scaffold529:73920-76981(+) / protein_length=731 / sequence_SO=supercontig / SO=protein_coding / is_pseudo=false
MPAPSKPKRLGLDISLAAAGFKEQAQNAICSMCHDFIEEAVETDCNARHVFCRSCVEKCLDSCQPCPSCRGRLSKLSDAHPALVYAYENVKWKCLNYETGCDFTGTKRELETHLDLHCPEEETECPFLGCSEKIRRIAMDDHTRDCRFGPILCPYCSTLWPFIEMKEHLATCDKLPVQCRLNCGQRIPRGDLAAHMERDCPEAMIECFVPDCKEKILRKDVERHEEEFMKKHVQLLAKQMAALKTCGQNDPPKVPNQIAIPPGLYTIKTVHGTCLRAHPGLEGAKVDMQTANHANDWEVFQMIDLGNGRVALRSFHGTYMRAHPGGEGAKMDLQTGCGPWEEFTLVRADGNRFGIRSAHGTYLRAHKGGVGATLDLQVNKNEWNAMPWEQFEFVEEKFEGIEKDKHEMKRKENYTRLIIKQEAALKKEKEQKEALLKVPDYNVPVFLSPGVYTIKTVHGTCLRAHPGGEGAKVDMQTSVRASDWEEWQVVDLGNGRVALRSFHGTYMRAHPGGEGAEIDLQTGCNLWEEFTIVQAVDGRFGIRSAHGTYLRAHKGGVGATLDLQVNKNDWNAMPWEQFEFVEKKDTQEVPHSTGVPPGIFVIKTVHGTCLRAHPGGEGAKVDVQTAVRASDWEKWQVIDLGNGRVALRSFHGTYMRAHPGGEGAKMDLQTGCGPWEEFTLVRADGNRFGIRSAHGTYLRAHKGGVGATLDLQVNKNEWNAMPWEQFEFVEV